MELKVIRKIRTDDSTIGEMYVNGKLMFYTLEDPERDVKIKHKTAIPTGRYRVVINFSERFKQYMPLLLNVPNFQGVRIHSGNDSSDTSGCILCGKTYAKDYVGQSRQAFKELMAILNKVDKKEAIYITIE